MPVTNQVSHINKVTCMTGRTGKSVKNQYIIHAPEGRYFQSYAALVAFQSHCKGTTLLDSRFWRYSKTTMKYLSQFIGEPMHVITEKAKTGLYKLVENLVDQIE